MSEKASQAPARTRSRARWTHLGLFALYLAALGLLIAWEAREALEGQTDECEYRDEPRSSLYSRPYAALLRWASPETAGHVVAVAIPADLEEIQSNLCLARAYLADVLRVLAKQGPAVVVIDKFFGANSCARTPEYTQSLLTAVQALPVPVVIGESTDGIEQMVSRTCLVRKEQLDFHSPNVVHGLTRLNAQTERFALRWSVLQSNPRQGEANHGEAPHEPAADTQHTPAAHPAIEVRDSLSLAAVRAYDPALVEQPGLQRLIAKDQQAYSNLNAAVPRTTTTQLLCASGDAALQQRWGLHCEPGSAQPRLLGKVVVIGAEQASDLKSVLGRPMWGFQLQAAYIEALLSGDYLRSVPALVAVAMFAFFVFLVEGVPILLQVYAPHWNRKMLLRYAYPRQRYVWVVFWTFATILGSGLLCMALRYLPPLLVYGDVLLVAVTRLIYFSAESAEHPLTHAHHHPEDNHV